MLLEQVLHIMLNQDYPRSVIISTENIWTFALRYIRGCRLILRIQYL